MAAGKRRQKVAARHGKKCRYCGYLTWITPHERGKIEETFPTSIAPGRHKTLASLARMFTVDHIHAQANGGGNELENTIPACQFCNGMKGNHDADQFKAILSYMVRKEIHPHQIFQATGVWMTPAPIEIHRIRKPNK